MQPDVERGTLQGVVDAFALPTGPTIPQGEEFRAQVMTHFITKDPVEVVEQFLLGIRAEHVQRFIIDLQDFDSLHAGVYVRRLFIEMFAQVCHTLRPQCLEEHSDPALILLPKRDGGVGEQASK